ncbi:hypothetical protein F442_00351 [Phytophthora nicotianae P10297]|uniref:Uncharacterized protein n=1 Tax=Phytophthora nicotianae P10297 TaxID=1317064 RepID=W3A764_PHYNI|nr:hypothetical protein F442_00351 [Phytophthora nicotianae P10297]
MPDLSSETSTEVVKLSYWMFAVWWMILLGIHVVAGVYTALYAYCYWFLKDTFLNYNLEVYQIGMPAPYHKMISIVHASMSGLHGVCIILMVSGSIWQRSLSFTPWSSCNADAKSVEDKVFRTRSALMESFSKVYGKVTDRHGFCGVNGEHFPVLLVCREILETVLQTIQAYRMSMLLPRTLLNRFYVVLLVTNCWSSIVIYSFFFKGDEARRRFVCIILDCILDLMSCMGVQLMVVLSYWSDYVVDLGGFWDFVWYDDMWTARALNEFRVVVVVSWSDLISRVIFSVGLILATNSIKRLLRHLPRGNNRMVQCVNEATVVPKLKLKSETSCDADKAASIMPTPRLWLLRDRRNVRSRLEKNLLHTAHLLFAAWGLVVLGFHIHASAQPSLPQCLMQVRPWTASRPSCYLVGFDCHTLAISGRLTEVEEKFSEFDGTTVVQLLILHCPALEMPESIAGFLTLRGIKVYNSTIFDWGESAAITNTNHPEMASLYVIRTNMTNGLLPAGFQSLDFPHNMHDIDFCVTNLHTLPDDLDSKWPHNSVIMIEFSQLLIIPPVILRLEPIYLSVSGNPITEIPPEIFEIPGLLILGIGATNINELPRDVTLPSSTLSVVQLGETNISFFWSWMDQLIEGPMGPVLLWASDSPYCTDLYKIQKGTADTFSVPMSPEYSSYLMNSSETNMEVITNTVICSKSDPHLYFLTIDDFNLAISTPQALVRP